MLCVVLFSAESASFSIVPNNSSTCKFAFIATPGAFAQGDGTQKLHYQYFNVTASGYDFYGKIIELDCMYLP